MSSKSKSDNPRSGDGASPGKIFIGGLPKDTQYSEFNKHFGKYGEITDSVIMKDRLSGQPRGFGFITYADPSVVDAVIEDTHVFNGKQVEIKRTIPKGSSQTKDFKTKKVFVGGIPSSVTEDELKTFFSKYGTVSEHQIIRDHETNRSRGFGFVIFDSEEVVDELLSNGNMIDMSGTQVEVKKAEPKKSTNQPPAPAYGSKSRARSFNDDFGGYGHSYGGGFEGGYGPGPYRTPGGFGRLGGYGGYGGGGGGGGGEYGGYGDYGGGALGGGYRGESSLGYTSRFGSYGGGFGGSYGGGAGGGGLGGYGRGEYGGYGGSGGSGGGYGGGYESGRQLTSPSAMTTISIATMIPLRLHQTYRLTPFMTHHPRCGSHSKTPSTIPNSNQARASTKRIRCSHRRTVRNFTRNSRNAGSYTQQYTT